MFPDSRIAENFTLSCTSASVITGQGLAPYFTQVIIDDLLESKLPFSVHFDETTIKIKQRNQMDLTLRYWSPKHKEVWTIFDSSRFFGHAKGENVAAVMYEKMVKDGLPVEKLATLVRDGPNVNKTIFQKMNELISQDHLEFKGLIDLGFLHNSHCSQCLWERYAAVWERKLISCVWIFIHCSSTVLQDVKISKSFRRNLIWKYTISYNTLRFVG